MTEPFVPADIDLRNFDYMPLKVAQLVQSHTNFTGSRGLYTSFFVFAMNKAKYDALPADIKKVIDANSGMSASKWVGRVMDEGDAPGIVAAQAAGNKMITLDAAETARWKAAAAPIADAWVKEMTEKGLPAAAMLAESGLTSRELREMVVSPGGTTQAGLTSLESHHFREALIAAVETATRRARELAAA